MQKRIASMLFVVIAAACHREAATPATSTQTATAPSGLVGTTKAVAGEVTTTPAIGTDPPTIGAIVNVPALAGRTRKNVETVLGPPQSDGATVYSVSGNSVNVYYDGDGRAVWFSMDLTTPAPGAADALRLFSIDAVTLTPTADTDARVEYRVPFSGVDMGVSGKARTLRAVATKAPRAFDWTHIGAGLVEHSEPPSTPTTTDTTATTDTSATTTDLTTTQLEEP